MEEKPHYLGHRDRLRKRFLDGEKLPTYELLELLLFQANPRKDTKPLAKKLLNRFGSMERVLSADVCLLKDQELTPSTISTLKLAYSIHLHLLHHAMFQREPLNTQERMIEFLHSRLAPLTDEVFYVIYLDAGFGLIQDIVHQKGSFNQVAVYPRSIIKTALDLGAAKIILAHNHPDGNPKPSFEDLQLTKTIDDLARRLEIQLLDHFIVGHSETTSLRALGYL